MTGKGNEGKAKNQKAVFHDRKKVWVNGCFWPGRAFGGIDAGGGKKAQTSFRIFLATSFLG